MTSSSAYDEPLLRRWHRLKAWVPCSSCRLCTRRLPVHGPFSARATAGMCVASCHPCTYQRRYSPLTPDSHPRTAHHARASPHDDLMCTPLPYVQEVRHELGLPVGRLAMLNAHREDKVGIGEALKPLQACMVGGEFDEDAFLCICAPHAVCGRSLSRIATRFRAEQCVDSLSVIVKTLSCARFTCVLARCIFVFYAFSRAILRLHLKYPLSLGLANIRSRRNRK